MGEEVEDSLVTLALVTSSVPRDVPPGYLDRIEVRATPDCIVDENLGFPEVFAPGRSAELVGARRPWGREAVDVRNLLCLGLHRINEALLLRHAGDAESIEGICAGFEGW